MCRRHADNIEARQAIASAGPLGFRRPFASPLSCGNLRERAVIDLLASTGMRVGELVRLRRKDIDFESRECVVYGKGNKRRKVYFDAKTKIHLQGYLSSAQMRIRLYSFRLRPHISLSILAGSNPGFARLVGRRWASGFIRISSVAPWRRGQ